MSNKSLIRIICLMCACALSGTAYARHTHIHIPPTTTDATSLINRAIDSIIQSTTDSTTIHLSPQSTYHLSKLCAISRKYHISNTTSAGENPDPTKHIGILLKGLHNIAIDGHGATLLTHGEMTPWIIDSCENVTLTDIIIDAADPSVTEMTVYAVTDSSMTCVPHPTSDYTIADSRLYWRGEGWCFTGGIAQKYSPATGFTLRCPSPVSDATSVTKTDHGELIFKLSGTHDAKAGDVYQMRHSLRTEVAGFINRSKNVRLDNITFRFMGNFGIVAQYSENLTYRNLRCSPSHESGRTCSGFADFLQISGCKGLIDIRECLFAGSHDDPINIHGTHLKVMDFPAADKAVVRFMHPQTYGFQAFSTGDEIDFIDAGTLNQESTATVTSCEMLNDYEQLLTFDTNLPASVLTHQDMVVENATWTPNVEISHNIFTLTPTRGILVTTRGNVKITQNRFVKIPMSAILISDDAKSWYESGYVRDVLISGNSFEQCRGPVVLIWPENNTCNRPVHENIRITENHFINTTGTPIIKARCVSGLDISHNTFIPSDPSGTRKIQEIIDTTECHKLSLKHNE